MHCIELSKITEKKSVIPYGILHFFRLATELKKKPHTNTLNAHIVIKIAHIIIIPFPNNSFHSMNKSARDSTTHYLNIVILSMRAFCKSLRWILEQRRTSGRTRNTSSKQQKKINKAVKIVYTKGQKYAVEKKTLSDNLNGR